MSSLTENVSTTFNSERIILKRDTFSGGKCIYVSKHRLTGGGLRHRRLFSVQHQQMQAGSFGSNYNQSDVDDISRHAGARLPRRTHLNQYSIKPLQRTIQMDLDPARCACYSLSPDKCTHHVTKYYCKPNHVCFIRHYTCVGPGVYNEPKLSRGR